MRILITVEYYAVAGGGGIAEQAMQIAERLKSFGHDVIVATGFARNRPGEIHGVTIIGFAVSGNAISGIRGQRTRYEEFLIGGRFDAIIHFAANTWTTDIALEIAEKISSPQILSTPGLSKLGDPVYDAYYKGLYLKGLTKFKKIVYTSANYRDKLFGDDHGLAGKAVIIPNGASEEEFSASDSYYFKDSYNITTPRLAICVANHFVAKGHSFVIKAFKLMRRSDTTLAIIGEARVGKGLKSAGHFILDYVRCKFASMINPKIKLISGAPREAVISAYKEADVFLFGSELECSPLVMYESFASQTPFVTRPVGNVTDYADVIKIAENPLAMASAGNYLLDDEQAAQKMADSAYKLWKKHYTWDAVAKKYEICLKSL